MNSTSFSCPHRATNAPGELASCGLVYDLVGGNEDLVAVSDKMCEACLCCGVSAAGSLNPVTAAILLHATSRIVSMRGAPDCPERKAQRLREWAMTSLETREDVPEVIHLEWPKPPRSRLVSIASDGLQ